MANPSAGNGLRITTWNVNGIRNPFAYQPWRNKTFEAMFDILDADIVVLQETKIQRKDLRDDMVLVPGWDNYWSLPRHKRGYSGVVIYTRNATCAPIKAEEGITGILAPPNSTTPVRDLPEHIGGYPTADQLAQSDYDAATLDAEGRAVVLEFPAFVLIGTYCPADTRTHRTSPADATRTHDRNDTCTPADTRTYYRTSFLRVLDARIRNLVRMGKRVVWAGDFNIARDLIDSAAADRMRHGIDPDDRMAEWISTPARRLFNQLVGGTVHGREEPVMWDLCRAFHPARTGMYTCWDTKVNARPGNYGSRIDYVVCSADMKHWFRDADIQEGLLGSDHCPVYAVLHDIVRVGHDGHATHILDLVNPPGTFVGGVRVQPWSSTWLLPLSGKLLPEFDKRQSIREMFMTSKSDAESIKPTPSPRNPSKANTTLTANSTTKANSTLIANSTPTKSNGKRAARSEEPAPKRSKANSTAKGQSKGQQSLTGFFAPTPKPKGSTPSPKVVSPKHTSSTATAYEAPDMAAPTPSQPHTAPNDAVSTNHTWHHLFSPLVPPRCEHDEPCKTMVTKKPGPNCGRSFWMCNRPLGPNGRPEGPWRCRTFIWGSDWTTRI